MDQINQLVDAGMPPSDHTGVILISIAAVDNKNICTLDEIL
jgi:hypothetical protein